MVDNSNESNSLHKLSQLLHEERGRNFLLKRELSTMKVNLYQERIRVQQLQIEKAKCMREHKTYVPKSHQNCSSYREDMDESYSCSNYSQEKRKHGMLEHYENLIRKLQDQVEVLLKEQDTCLDNFLDDFEQCQTHIAALNDEIQCLEKCCDETSAALNIYVENLISLKKENKSLVKLQNKSETIKKTNAATKSKNRFLCSENEYFKSQITTMSKTIANLKIQRGHLLRELREAKSALVENKEILYQKIHKLTRELCSLRYKTIGVKCGDFNTRNFQCICHKCDS